jgi:hypothetical protein
MAKDKTPNQFAFTTQNDVPSGTECISNAVQITGINTSAPISVDPGWFYSINNGAWLSGASSVAPNAFVRMKGTAATNAGAQATGRLTIGGVSGYFTLVTGADVPILVITKPVVAPATLVLLPATLPAATIGAAYNQTFTSTGGTGAKTYSIVSGTLPAWVTFNSNTGNISGTPTGGATTVAFSVRVTDSATPTPATATIAYTWVINAAAGPGAFSTFHQSIFDTFGPFNTVAEAIAQGGMSKVYEETFSYFGDFYWTLDGTIVYGAGGGGSGQTGGAYYDRPLMWYIWDARTLGGTSPDYRARADAAAVAYRTFVQGTNLPSYMMFPRGLFAHAMSMIAAGDTTSATASKLAIMKIADQTYGKTSADILSYDIRDRARWFQSHVWASKCTGMTSAAGYTAAQFATEATRWYNILKVQQDANGNWPFYYPLVVDTNGVEQQDFTIYLPYMAGLQFDVFLEYSQHVANVDAELLTIGKSTADAIWTKFGISPHMGIPFSVYVSGRTFGLNQDWTPSQNNQMVNVFAWLYMKTGDARYLNRADALNAGVLAWGYYGTTSEGAADKAFNETFNYSFKYMYWRGNIAGAASPSIVWDPKALTLNWNRYGATNTAGLTGPDGDQASSIAVTGSWPLETQLLWARSRNGIARARLKKPSSGGSDYVRVTTLSTLYTWNTGASARLGPITTSWADYNTPLMEFISRTDTRGNILLRLAGVDAAGTADGLCSGAVHVAQFDLFAGDTPGDAVPDAFTIPAKTGQAANTAVISNPVTITGITTPAAITVAAGMSFRINGGPWRSSSDVLAYPHSYFGTKLNVNVPYCVVANDQVEFRLTSSPSAFTTVTARATIGESDLTGKRFADFQVSTA